MAKSQHGVDNSLTHSKCLAYTKHQKEHGRHGMPVLVDVKMGRAIIAHIHNELGKSPIDDWKGIIASWSDVLVQLETIRGLKGSVRDVRKYASV